MLDHKVNKMREVAGNKPIRCSTMRSTCQLGMLFTTTTTSTYLLGTGPCRLYNNVQSESYARAGDLLQIMA